MTNPQATPLPEDQRSWRRLPRNIWVLTAASFLTDLSSEMVVHLLGRKRVLLTGWLLYALIYLGFALARHGGHLLLLFGAYGLYYGLSEGIAKAFVADLVQPQQRGTAYGWFNGAVGLAALPASLIAGLMWQGAGSWSGFGMAAPFLFGGLLALIAAGLLLIWLPGAVVPKSQ